MSEVLETLSYWVSRPGEGELRAQRLPSEPAAGHSHLRAECGAVSAGTERLVGLGLVPASCAVSMACRYMEGGFALPVKYGYALVGRGVRGALRGQRAFVMHPHQELAAVADEHVTPLPDAVPSHRAVLIPNLETALNATWDAELHPDDRAVVVGAGAVGLLVSYVLWRARGAPVAVADDDASRREFASSLPWVDRACAPRELAGAEAQVAFHASGVPAGLRSALDAVGFEGRVVELSWYGERPVTLELGTHFHYQRKRILASQVSTVARSHRHTHGYRERLAEVLALLGDPTLDRMLGDPVPFRSLPEFMSELYRGRNPYPVPLIEYPPA